MEDMASTTGVALSALFQLCVPAVSGGNLKQSFPPEMLIALTDDEKEEFAEDLKETSEAWRVKAPDGLVLFLVLGPSRRILAVDGNSAEAKTEFLKRLKAMKGVVESKFVPAPDAETLGTMVPVSETRSVAISFTTYLTDDATGFYASAFLAERKH
jgi:hypothetical protein